MLVNEVIGKEPSVGKRKCRETIENGPATNKSDTLEAIKVAAVSKTQYLNSRQYC